MNSTAAGLPFTVTDVPSRLTGNLPLTISRRLVPFARVSRWREAGPEDGDPRTARDWPASRKAGVVHDARDCRFRGCRLTAYKHPSSADSLVVGESAQYGRSPVTRQRDGLSLIGVTYGTRADQLAALLSPHATRARVHPHRSDIAVVLGTAN